MPGRKSAGWLAVLALGLASWPACATARAQAAGNAPAKAARAAAIYRKLRPEIRRIPIFDNHGHPGFAGDTDVDAMKTPPGLSLPLRLRPGNPELVEAMRRLFAYPYHDFAPAHARWLRRRKAELARREGREYFSRLLNRLGIRVAVANRVAMPAYLDPARFRWVFFVDPFLFPLNNRLQSARNPDEAVYIPREQHVLGRYLRLAGRQRPPARLSAYLELIRRVLRMEMAHGVVGIKFEVAYFRRLEFADPSRAQAAAVYDRYLRHAPPTNRRYRVLQDYLFRYLLRQAARLRLPVQIHAFGGVGNYISLSKSNVLRLENVLRDPRYRGVTFILLHGGYPYDRQAIWLTTMPNVYLDSSLMELILYPEEMSRILQRWLELFPQKVLFGSDAFPFSRTVGAEGMYWLAVHSAREALGLALARMIAAGEISHRRALQLARGYLETNAARLYPAPRGHW